MNTIDVSRPVSGVPLAVDDKFFAHSFNRRNTEPINPLLMVDHFWMKRDTFGWHPHRAISAVTYVFEDSKSAHQNFDTLGNDLPIRPGSLHWLVAGSGVAHREYPEGPDALVHGLQLFVDLPASLKDATPYAIHLDTGEIPEVSRNGARVRVVAGEYDGVRSPAELPQPFILHDVLLGPGSRLEVPLPGGWGGSVVSVSGATTVAGGGRSDRIANGQAMGVRSNANGAVIALSSNDAARVVVLAGQIVPPMN